MSSEKPIKHERFGRYLILDHLVDGGMAKICRARFLGEQADKVVAIKMVQPQFSKDESFKIMFMDEIKVAFGLQHPNIIQTFDYGIQNEQLFVAMEYIDGKNLKEYLDKIKEKGFVFPVDVTTFILTQVCSGLHYAHTLTDRLSGKEYKLVHRDISPHNIMLDFDGAVKIIDFGIAKSRSNAEATQAGTIKGKLAYLAPEYLDGLELDHRYDQFAVGITLWEMLCGRRLFVANNDLATLKKIQECKVPLPSTINPNVPKELDAIVMRALSKDRNKRFKDLDEMCKHLNKFLYLNFPDFNSSDLRYFTQELFSDYIKKDRERLFEFGRIDIKPYIEELKRELQGNSTGKVNVGGDTTRKSVKEGKEFDFTEDISDESQLKKAAGAAAALKAQQSKSRLAIKKESEKNSTIILDSNRGNGSRKALSNSSKTRATKDNLSSSELSGAVEKAKIEFAAKVDQKNKRNLIFMVASLLSLIMVYFHSNKEISIEQRAPAAIVQEKQSPEAPIVPKIRKLVLNNFDKFKQNVYINNEQVIVTILGEIETEVTKGVLRVETPGHMHFVRPYDFGAEDFISIDVDDTDPELFSYLTMSRECVRGKIHYEIYGEKIVEDLPIKRKPGILLPVQHDANSAKVIPTIYSFALEKTGEENIQRKIFVTVDKEDELYDFCEIISNVN
jgi:serine/threonine-protein kinase